MKRYNALKFSIYFVGAIGLLWQNVAASTSVEFSTENSFIRSVSHSLPGDMPFETPSAFESDSFSAELPVHMLSPLHQYLSGIAVWSPVQNTGIQVTGRRDRPPQSTRG